MKSEQVFDQLREALNGRPGQPIVFGVCRSVAERFGLEPWIVRAVAIVLGVFFTLATVVIYVILGLALPDTEERTRKFFSGLAVLTRETADRLACRLRELLRGENCSRPRGEGY